MICFSSDKLLTVRSFGVIWIRISDPRSLRSWCIKGTDESTLVTDSSVPLMQHDPSDPDPDHLKGTHDVSRDVTNPVRNRIGDVILKGFDVLPTINTLYTISTVSTVVNRYLKGA